MNKSEEMRKLAREGLPVAEIARRVGVRYQFARNVISQAGLLAQLSSNVLPRAGVGSGRAPLPRPAKPALTVEALLAAGFVKAADWTLSPEGYITPSQPLPKLRGVYSFAQGGVALYVGLATMGLAKRLYFYGRPGVTQRTSIRVNGLLKTAVEKGESIEVYVATPNDLVWNGLPVSGAAGLELGLIETYSLPWNIRGALA